MFRHQLCNNNNNNSNNNVMLVLTRCYVMFVDHIDEVCCKLLRTRRVNSVYL